MPAPARARMPLAPEVTALIDAFLAQPGPRVAAFDADGTLWRGDVGEDFLRFLAAEGRLPRFPGRTDVYAEYERRVSVDPAAGFAFAAEAMVGMAEAEVMALCRDFFTRRFEGRVFPFARSLLAQLQALDVQVWIVSGSPLWPVLAGAECLGVPAERVIAVRTPVVDGRLAGAALHPVPTLHGKPEGLRARGVTCGLAAGNSVLDVPMLAAAERAFVVAPHGDSQGEMVRIAREQGWPVQWG